jgi:hypothetical protein
VGSNDGTTWNTLLNKINITPWASTETKTYTFFNEIQYKYYRIIVNKTNTGQQIWVDQIIFYGYDNTMYLNTFVGIGTNTPISKFTILNSYPNDLNGGFCLDAKDTINTYNLKLYSFSSAYLQTSYNFQVNNITSSYDALTLGYNGNIGIGTTNPQQKLEVNGIIKCDNIILPKQCNAYVGGTGNWYSLGYGEFSLLNFYNYSFIKLANINNDPTITISNEALTVSITGLYFIKFKGIINNISGKFFISKNFSPLLDLNPSNIGSSQNIDYLIDYSEIKTNSCDFSTIKLLTSGDVIRFGFFRETDGDGYYSKIYIKLMTLNYSN